MSPIARYATILRLQRSARGPLRTTPKISPSRLSNMMVAIPQTKSDSRSRRRRPPQSSAPPAARTSASWCSRLAQGACPHGYGPRQAEWALAGPCDRMGDRVGPVRGAISRWLSLPRPNNGITGVITTLRRYAVGLADFDLLLATCYRVGDYPCRPRQSQVDRVASPRKM